MSIFLQIPFLVNIMHENLHDFAQNTACFCLPVHMSFWTSDMATCELLCFGHCVMCSHSYFEVVFNVFCCLGGDQLKVSIHIYMRVFILFKTSDMISLRSFSATCILQSSW